MTSTASVPPQTAAPAFGKFFLPGPTDVHPEVLAAMLRPMIGHRSSGMEKLFGCGTAIFWETNAPQVLRL